MKKTKGFNLLTVLIIMVFTSIIASLATGVIMLNAAPKYKVNSNIKNDENLEEFVNVYETILSKYYDDNIDKKGMLNAAEEAMLNFLGDKYTTYLNDTEYKDIIDELSGTYDGIGIMIKGNVIVDVLDDSPAMKSGILKNDIITKINDIKIDTDYDLNLTEEEKEFLTGEQVKSLIKQNSNNKEIKLEIKRGESTLIYNVNKENIINPIITHKKIDNTSIGYIYIKNFSSNLKVQVSKALDELERNNITSLIIDLRDNVGGYLTSLEDVASMFIENGKIIYSLETSNSKFDYKDKTKEKRDYPIVVIINGNSASASEILASALKESYNATLVGTKSYGKGKVQQVVPLNNGDSVKYTSAKWLTPKGVCIDGVGITPDYVVEESTLSDTQLDKAIELLS